MLDCGRRFLLLVRSFYNCSRQALGQNAECPPAKLRDFLNSAVDQVYEASEIGIDVVTKGQLISNCPFGVFKSPKKPTKFFPEFLP